MSQPIVYHLKALTNIWTGDASGKSGRLITTGLLGSIRWWFEIVIRGLGGRVCDPSNTECIDRVHCAACELFGCTGWGRKFRFDVLDGDGNIQQGQIKRDGCFQLRFTPLRSIAPEEWALLDLTLRLIAGYGAIGGKTAFKPTDEAKRARELHHTDFGLVRLTGLPLRDGVAAQEMLESYANPARWSRPDQAGFSWATLDNFWFVAGKHLARQDANQSTFNQVIGRPEPKSRASNGDSWLAGHRARSRQGKQAEVKAESKKVFSFRNPPRTFGFVNPPAIILDTIKKRLEAAWGSGSVANGELLTGTEILEILLRPEGST